MERSTLMICTIRSNFITNTRIKLKKIFFELIEEEINIVTTRFHIEYATNKQSYIVS